MRSFPALITALAIVLLAACGGGGGDGGRGPILSSSSISSSASSTSSSLTTSSSSSAQQFTVGGSVAGLAGVLQLRLTAGETLQLVTVTRSGSFIFSTALPVGHGYQVAIVSQPDAQQCELANGFGQITGNVTNVVITCTAAGAVASLSGKISPTAGIAVDTTVNDIEARFVDNSRPSTPQRISNRVTLQGFAAAEPTQGDPRYERYSASVNEDDYYRVSLQAGQVIQLQVVDFEGFNVGSRFEGDLDLWLYTSSGDFVAYSDGVAEYEQIIVPADGDYLLNVWAYSGISKYVLRILPPGAEGFESAAIADFVPHEMIVAWDEPSGAAVGMQKQLRSVARLSHGDTTRPTLVQMAPETVNLAAAGLQKGSARQSLALTDLQQLNPESYAKVVTLRNIKALRQQPGVRYAEPNYLRYPFRVPNDPGFIHQWHYNAISLPQAWDITTGTRPTGQEVIVAVLDTGVYLAHPDLAGQLVGGYDFISSAANARDGDGIDANPDDPGDSSQRGQSSWHGTHVAGTIAAASNNGLGVAGVAWGARIMPIRVLGQNGGTSYDIVQGLRYAARLSNDSGTLPPRRADIANLSLGGSSGSLAESEAYRLARATGMIIVAAAGNSNTSSPSYPAAYESVISVSATDFGNQRAPYSNFGSTITLAAPGGNARVDLNGDGYPDGVLSLSADDTSGSRTSAYRFLQGTSMAAPHVAGVLALMKTVHPGLTPDQVDQVIQSGQITDDLGAPGRDNVYGYGLINALKAVRVASELAAGGSLPAWPPQLQASPASVNLGLATTATVTLTNQGGGAPQITAVTTDQPWLAIAPLSVDAGGLGSYRITVNRTGLEVGYYQGQVTFSSAQAPVVVTVNMQVGTVLTEGELAQLYVLLLNPATNTALYQTLPTRVGNELVYRFEGIPLGEYIVIGGSDIDADEFICQSGESCGAYPSLAQRQPVSLQGVNLSGLDFVADILGYFQASGTAAAGDGPAGIARLPVLPPSQSPRRRLE